MYAVVRIAGKQFEVRPQERLRVPHLGGEVGSTLEFDEVLLLSGESDMQVGTPTIEGAKVTARLLGHEREDTILVFRKKRRKDYKKKNGHRQPYSEIQIEEILAP